MFEILWVLLSWTQDNMIQFQLMGEMVHMSYIDFSLYLGLYYWAFAQTPEYAALNTHAPAGIPQQTRW